MRRFDWRTIKGNAITLYHKYNRAETFKRRNHKWHFWMLLLILPAPAAVKFFDFSVWELSIAKQKQVSFEVNRHASLWSLQKKQNYTGNKESIPKGLFFNIRTEISALQFFFFLLTRHGNFKRMKGNLLNKASILCLKLILILFFFKRFKSNHILVNACNAKHINHIEYQMHEKK